MTSKRFKLEKILDLRRRSERETAVKVAEEAERLSAAEEARDLAYAIRQSSAEGVAQVHGGVGRARSIAQLRILLDAHVTHTESVHAEAKGNLEAVLVELKHRSIARRAIERIKETRLALARTHQARVEQKTLDNSVHARGLPLADSVENRQ